MINRRKNGSGLKETAINRQKSENVEMLKYVGSLAANINKVEVEMKVRSTASSKCYHAVGHTLNKRCVT